LLHWLSKTFYINNAVSFAPIHGLGRADFAGLLVFLFEMSTYASMAFIKAPISAVIFSRINLSAASLSTKVKALPKGQQKLIKPARRQLQTEAVHTPKACARV
jgi:hypothetical protein